MTDTMRAISQDRLGGPEVLKLIETGRPEPGHTQVQVEVHAAGINPVDFKTRSHGLGGRIPPILGWDVSGVVTALGPGVRRFAVGDEVYGMPNFPQTGGGYAQYITAPSRHFDRKPAGIDHVHAAALPLAGLTAWQALVDVAQVRPGQRVLVHAAAGGVGHLAVQIAKHLGAEVIGTASAGKHDFLHGLGADEVIDYATVDFTEVLSDVDVVLDPIGGEYGPRSVSVLRDGGVLVTFSDDEPLITAEHRARVETGFMLVEPDLVGMRAISELVAAGRLRAEVAQTFPLAAAGEAHSALETNRTTGKIVLTVSES